jgi:DNA-binding IclR family transcriptional regulator
VNVTALSAKTRLSISGEVEQAPPNQADASRLDTSVGKAVAVLNAFQGSGGALLGVSQVAERAHLAKSTAHRILNVLVENGYVERTGERYRLGRAVFELGQLVPGCRPRKRTPAMPFLMDLYEFTHSTVHLAILDGPDVLYLQKIYGSHTIILPSRVGGRVPALCTSLGKAILAFSDAGTRDALLAAPVPRLTPRTVVNPLHLRAALDRFQASGIAEDFEGTVLGARCVAAPIFADDSGFATAAVSISCATGDSIPPAAITRLRQTAEAIASHC